MKPSPQKSCLAGTSLVKEIGRQLSYNFNVDEDARGASASRLGKDGIHIDIQDTRETSRFIDISNDGTMMVRVIVDGEHGDSTGQKLFSKATVARAYAFLVGNEKACKVTAR